MSCLVVLATLAGCRTAPRGLLRVAAPAGRSMTEVEVAGETRPAFFLPSGSRVRFEIGAAGPGRVEIGAAVAERSAAELVVRLEGQPAQDAESGHCTLHWSEENEPHWQDCRLELDSAAQSLAVVVETNGGEIPLAVETPRLVEPSETRDGSVFVFLVDTLRADVTRIYGDAAMPGANLQRLASSAWLYRHARSTSSWTRTAVASLFTGARPATHRVYGRYDVLDSKQPLLAEAFARNGWRTIALSANPNVLTRWGFSRGFDKFVDVGAASWASRKTDASELFDALERELSANRGVRTLYYVQFMDVHAPYQPDPEDAEAIGDGEAYRRLFPGRDSAGNADAWKMYRDYLAELRGFDRELGRFLDRLGKRHLAESSTILLLSDHGEEFLDHGFLFHGRSLYEEQLEVPLVLKPPGKLPPREIDADIGIEDVAPTLAALLGIPGQWPDGHDLRPDSAYRAAWRLAELRLDDHSLASALRGSDKLILDQAAAREELYDLANDPREKTNLATQRPARVEELREIVAVDDSRGTPGWHLRFCGGETRTTTGIRIDGVHSPPRALGLEADDSLTQAGQTWQIHVALTPHLSQREVFGRISSLLVGDEDELVFTDSSAAPRLEPLGGLPVAIAFGASPKSTAVGVLDLRQRMAASTLRPGDVAGCGTVSTRADDPRPHNPPYLRIWFVPPAGSAPLQMDRQLEERLKGLGYLN